MIIYKATNKINGDFYIGLSKYPIEDRRKGHYKEAAGSRSNGLFHNAIRKYGEDCFVWEVIDTASSLEKLKQLEIKYIAELNPRYNMTAGGDGIMTGKIPWNKGKNLPDYLKKRISLKLKGCKVPEEVKDKISKTMTGRKYSEERRLAMSEGWKKKRTVLVPLKSS
jgi:group I intron endonuclease